jgi:hypothetical protein
MSKLKLWRYFSLFMVLLLMSSLVAVVPARPAQANVSRPPTEIDEGGIFSPAQLIVPLGSAAAFAVLAGSTVTNTGATMVNGNLGVSPGSAVVGFPPGYVNGNTYTGVGSAAGQAQLDLTTAYNDAAGRTLAPVTVAGNIGGQTLAPGLYKSTSSLAISSGNLTLDAQGNANAVWIFQIASTLTTTSGRRVILSGGANAANIFWQVGTSATLGTTSVFHGNILADQSITITTGATLNGRALARVGAVTLGGNIVTIPSMATSIPPTPSIGMTVNPYDTRIINLNTGYRITMTTGASLNTGNTITIEFPLDTTVPDPIAAGNVFVNGTPSSTVVVSGQRVTVTIPATMSPIVPGQQFTVTFNQASGILNPTTSGPYNVTGWTSVEPIHITSSPYEITAVRVYTGPTFQSEWFTITAAIAAASAGDTITVPAGTYDEQVVINDILTLQSVGGAATTIIDASALAPAVESAVQIAANNVKLGGAGVGFTIIAPDGGVTKPDKYGVDVLADIDGATIEGNTIRGSTNADSNSPQIAIHSQMCTVHYHRDITIKNNSLTTTYVTDTSVDPPKTCGGIVLNHAGERLSLEGNTIDGFTVGINFLQPLVSFGEKCIIKNNIVKNSNYNGVVVDGDCFEISENQIFNNAGTGLRIVGDTFGTLGGAQVFQNSIYDNGNGVKLSGDATKVTLHYNNIYSNTNTSAVIGGYGPPVPYENYGVYNAGTGILDATNNWWGNASGPSHDSLSYGDAVSTNVTFQPWLVNTATGAASTTEIHITHTLSPQPLPDGNTGSTYSTPLVATGGAGTYTWALYSGTLPPGLSIVGSNLTGTPTVVNSTSGFIFALQVKDGTQATYQDFTLKVYGGGHVITTTSPLSNGTLNVPYGSVQLQATGGTGTYAWSLNTGSGPLPTGLGLASDGKISGTPTVAGTFPFNVKVESDGYSPGYKDLSITISAPPSVGQKLIGADDSTSTSVASGGYFALAQFTAEATGDITQIRVKCASSGSIKVAIYSDNSSQPYALLGAVNTPTAVIAGWNTITFPSTHVDAGTKYWLARNSDGNILYWKAQPGSLFRTRAAAFSGFSFPSSAGTLPISEQLYHLMAGWAAVTVTAPTVTNSPVSDKTQTSATLNGGVTAVGLENPTVIIYWGGTDGGTDPYAWGPSVNLGTKGAVPFSTDIAGLTPGTLYYYRCFAANSGGSDWADSSESFTTSVLSAPTVTNSTSASIVTTTSARLNGAITDTGGVNPTAIIYWGDNDGRTTSSNWDNTVNLGIKGKEAFSTDITDLNSGTKYYYRSFASNSIGPAWAGSSENFTTLSGGDQKLIGAAADSTFTNVAGGGYFALAQFTAEATGAITQIRVKCASSGNIKLAIYSDISGEPGTLLGAVNTPTTVNAGWNTITFPSTHVDAGTKYWLARNSDGNMLYWKAQPGSPFRYRAAAFSGSFPSSAGTGFGSDQLYHLIAGWGTSALPAPPAPPAIVTPKTTITFEWNAPSGATKYRLQVNTVSDFTGTSMFDAEVSTTSQDVKLTIGTPYYWRVKAGNTGGWSGWSATGSVTP